MTSHFKIMHHKLAFQQLSQGRFNQRDYLVHLHTILVCVKSNLQTIILALTCKSVKQIVQLTISKSSLTRKSKLNGNKQSNNNCRKMLENNPQVTLWFCCLLSYKIQEHCLEVNTSNTLKTTVKLPVGRHPWQGFYQKPGPGYRHPSTLNRVPGYLKCEIKKNNNKKIKHYQP